MGIDIGHRVGSVQAVKGSIAVGGTDEREATSLMLSFALLVPCLFAACASSLGHPSASSGSCSSSIWILRWSVYHTTVQQIEIV